MYLAFLVFIGSGVGGVLRFLIAGFVQLWWDGRGPWAGYFPAGTLLVNVTGCFAIGVLAGLAKGPTFLMREDVRVALVLGVLGGYTTFSSFGRETIVLAAEGRWLQALTNVALSNGLGLLATWAGLAIASSLCRTGAAT